MEMDIIRRMKLIKTRIARHLDFKVKKIVFPSLHTRRALINKPNLNIPFYLIWPVVNADMITNVDHPCPIYAKQKPKRILFPHQHKIPNEYILKTENPTKSGSVVRMNKTAQ